MRRNRQVLKGYFKRGLKPTEQQFADFIDSIFNFEEDVLESKYLETLIVNTLNGKIDKSALGKPNGVVPLDLNGKIPLEYLPSIEGNLTNILERLKYLEDNMPQALIIPSNTFS